MSDNKQIVRQLDILRELAAQTYGATFRELADLYEVSTRTIQRDLNDLKEAGFWIDEEMRDGKKYFKLENNLPPLNFPIEDPMDVKVRFSAWQARFIKQRIWHPSQEIEELDNGEIILSFQASGFYDIKSWILSHGADAEVLEPADLREEIIKELEKKMDFYKKT